MDLIGGLRKAKKWIEYCEKVIGKKSQRELSVPEDRIAPGTEVNTKKRCEEKSSTDHITSQVNAGNGEDGTCKSGLDDNTQTSNSTAIKVDITRRSEDVHKEQVDDTLVGMSADTTTENAAGGDSPLDSECTTVGEDKVVRENPSDTKLKPCESVSAKPSTIHAKNMNKLVAATALGKTQRTVRDEKSEHSNQSNQMADNDSSDASVVRGRGLNPSYNHWTRTRKRYKPSRRHHWTRTRCSPRTRCKF